MAEAYGRLTGRPLVVMGQGEWIAGNAGQGFLEALLGSSPIVILTEMSDGGALSHHAPVPERHRRLRHVGRPQRAGRRDEAGDGEPRPRAGGAAHAARVQARAHRRARAGRRDLPRPVVARAGSGRPRRRRSTRRPPTCRARRTPSTPTRWLRAVAALDGAARPVIIAGNGVRVGQACAELAVDRPALDAPVVTTASGKGVFDETDALAAGVMGTLRLAERQRGPRRRRRRARGRHQARPPRHRGRDDRPARPEPPDADPDRHRTAQRGMDVPGRPRARRRRRASCSRACATPWLAAPGPASAARRGGRGARSPRRARRTGVRERRRCRCAAAARRERAARGVPGRCDGVLRRRREPAVHDALGYVRAEPARSWRRGWARGAGRP